MVSTKRKVVSGHREMGVVCAGNLPSAAAPAQERVDSCTEL